MSAHALQELLAGDPSTLFITGAGLSADSGLPTYRGVGGLYEDQATDDGYTIEEALSGSVFRRDPAVTWKYIRQIEEACRAAGPNVAHRVIAALEGQLSRCATLTQNVDGLHVAAGSRNLIEIHGAVRRLRCTGCSWRDTVDDYAELAPLPLCAACGAVIRPDVVLFDEMLPRGPVARLEQELARGFDLVISVGTSSLFPYIAAPVWLCREQGGATVEINPGTTEVSRAVDLRMRVGAAEALGELGRRMGMVPA